VPTSTIKGTASQLAWLIDGDAETVYVYRPGHPPKTRRRLKQLGRIVTGHSVRNTKKANP